MEFETMSLEMLKEQAARCHRLATLADDTTRTRLLKLAEEYEERIREREQGDSSKGVSK
jgi:hypothetical protein